MQNVSNSRLYAGLLTCLLIFMHISFIDKNNGRADNQCFEKHSKNTVVKHSIFRGRKL